MKSLFDVAEHRKKIQGLECDVYIPSLSLGIEVDGLYWHKDKYDSDKHKSTVFSELNIPLIRVRDRGLKRVSDNDIFCSEKTPVVEVLHNILDQILLIASVA